MKAAERIKEIFAQALERKSPAEREKYLAEVCQGDPELRREVESLLNAGEQAGDFLGKTIQLTQSDFTAELAGTMIGRYKLLEKIGEGGFGTVYMAEQVEPVQRKVALKIIKAGMDTREVAARFEAERQALALMDHPNIARVLDAGATAAGRPYFVMELVRGIPITDYCDQKNLSTAERLQLFMKVCHAVQHAHQKAIIHRDLKPSNVLVTLHDGEPVPKVIDFGVAKALGQKLTEKTLFTGFAQMIGTPAYMSPEQAELSGLDIDTRSDIYSLGVLLYELLTGVTPFDAETLRKAALDEIRRMIRETEPPKPSTRLHTLGDKLDAVARQRHTEPKALWRLVHGDLDWIVMKALEKDRRRRYETPDAFASDVARHLSNEPVLASPPSVPYLVAKFVRRHKAGLATACALLVLLAAGAVVSTWQAVRATRAERTQSSLRQQAEQAGVNESQQRQRAEQLRATAEDQARRIGHQLYASHMNLAFQAWERGDLTRVAQLLDEHRPKPGGEDLRGFEWFYLWRLCHSDQMTLRGHFSNVRGVAFSPDGRLLVTAGDDSTARISNAQTGKELLVLRGHNSGVTAVAFAPDGKILATGGGDQTVRLWEVSTGEELAVLRGHKHGVSALAFSPDGRRLAVATGRLASGGNMNPTDKYVDPTPLPAEVKVWDVEGRKATLTLAGHTGSILSLAFSPDGKTLVTGSTDATVKLWNVETGTVETNLTGFNGPVVAVAFSPDGQSLAIGGGDPYRLRAELQIWDLVSRKASMTLKGHDGPVFAVAFSPDGRTLASGGLDQIVRFWDVATGEEVRNIKAHTASIWALAYDPSGKRIATASWDQTAKVWEAEQPQGFELLSGTASYSSCFSPDGKFLILGGGGRLQVLEVGTGKAPFTIPDYTPRDVIVAMAPDESVLASAGTDNLVTLWEVGTWRRLAQLQAHTDKVWQLAFSPDSRTLASSDAGVLRLWDVARRAERVAVRPATTDRIGPLLFTPDGRMLIVSGVRRTLFLDATTGRETRALDDTKWYTAISPDGSYLVEGSPSGLNLIDLKTMEAKWGINPHRANTWEVNFSPDGRTLATASWDGTAKLWNVASGQEMFTYKAPGVVWSVAFSPDGKWWAVGSGSARQGEVVLFRRATLAEVEAADSPSILVQPASQTVVQGSSLTLGVAAAGLSPLFYQWRIGAEALPGQTNATLTLTNVTEANAGNYSVVVTNALGSATSSDAILTVIQVHEAPVLGINFEDRQPSASYAAFTYSENPVALSTNIIIGPGLGAGGSAGLVMTADGTGFATNMNQRWAGFGVAINALACGTNLVTTTNLNLYKLSATIRTSGLTGTNSHARILWQFLSPGGIMLSRAFEATFTTNYQVYSLVFGEGRVDSNSRASWSEFVTGFDQINRVRCVVTADNWLPEYGPDADNALYIDDLKLVRLVPVPAPFPVNAASQNTPPKLRQTPPTKP